MKRAMAVVVLLVAANAQAKDKPAYERGTLLQMDSTSCGYAEKGSKTLAGEILHYTCDSLDEHRRRIEVYTDLAAREMLERRERPDVLRRWLGPPWVFAYTYLLRLGVLDGYQGFLIAWMAARYVRRKYAKLMRLERGTVQT